MSMYNNIIIINYFFIKILMSVVMTQMIAPKYVLTLKEASIVIATLDLY